ncbi:hypothetical protein BOTCAL_0374g00010 [Botryotinia calthae]|uniref:Uncharacterized protein n=1 Tax=Botryotinia calthae TaxID=38488 RepID=A0A4Y8CRN5_9HELO|nr:hypothetical protein BOTCAL_0374g00010 [Botryotinia calthae]
MSFPMIAQHQEKKRRHDVICTQVELSTPRIYNERYYYVQDPENQYCEGSSINVVSPWNYSSDFLFGREIAGLDGIIE